MSTRDEKAKAKLPKINPHGLGYRGEDGKLWPLHGGPPADHSDGCGETCPLYGTAEDARWREHSAAALARKRR